MINMEELGIEIAKSLIGKNSEIFNYETELLKRGLDETMVSEEFFDAFDKVTFCCAHCGIWYVPEVKKISYHGWDICNACVSVDVDTKTKG